MALKLGHAMPSLGGINWLNAWGWLSLLLESVWHPHALLLVPLRGHTGHEMDPYDLTALEKAACKNRHGHLQYNQMLDVFG